MNNKMSTSTKIKLLAVSAGTVALITPKLHAYDSWGALSCFDQALADSIDCIISCNPGENPTAQAACWDSCERTFDSKVFSCYC